MQDSNTPANAISKLMLGTVALGLDYGIANPTGKPGLQESNDILSFALNAGINAFDTARTYGTAEQLLGDFLSGNEKGKPVNIVTKFKIDPKNIQDRKKSREEVFESVKASLGHLKLQQVPVCLFHMNRELPRQAVMDVIPGIFEELLEAGLIGMAGISIDHPAEAEWFVDQPIIKALQVPMNVFDQRLLNNGMLNELHARGKMVFVRSIFLQGLFFLKSEELKGNLVKAAPYLYQLQALADTEGMSIAQLAFSYIKEMEEVTSIVFGAENVNQVAQNIALANGNPLSDDTREAIHLLFATIPENIITPGNWGAVANA